MKDGNRLEELQAIIPKLLNEISRNANKLATNINRKQSMLDFEMLLHKYMGYYNELKTLK